MRAIYDDTIALNLDNISKIEKEFDGISIDGIHIKSMEITNFSIREIIDVIESVKYPISEQEFIDLFRERLEV